jgi:cytochrome c oxidase cbb3-type subunit IV
MDLTDLSTMRSAVTVLSMFVFLGIIGWAYARRNRSDFDEAAQLPFLDDNQEGRAR